MLDLPGIRHHEDEVTILVYACAHSSIVVVKLVFCDTEAIVLKCDDDDGGELGILDFPGVSHHQVKVGISVYGSTHSRVVVHKLILCDLSVFVIW